MDSARSKRNRHLVR